MAARAVLRLWGRRLSVNPIKYKISNKQTWIPHRSSMGKRLKILVMKVTMRTQYWLLIEPWLTGRIKILPMNSLPYLPTAIERTKMQSSKNLWLSTTSLSKTSCRGAPMSKFNLSYINRTKVMMIKGTPMGWIASVGSLQSRIEMASSAKRSQQHSFSKSSRISFLNWDSHKLTKALMAPNLWILTALFRRSTMQTGGRGPFNQTWSPLCSSRKHYKSRPRQVQTVPASCWHRWRLAPIRQRAGLSPRTRKKSRIRTRTSWRSTWATSTKNRSGFPTKYRKRTNGRLTNR